MHVRVYSSPWQLLLFWRLQKSEPVTATSIRSTTFPLNRKAGQVARGAGVEKEKGER